MNPLPTTTATTTAGSSTTRLTHGQAHDFLASFLATAEINAAYRPDSRVTEGGVVASISSITSGPSGIGAGAGAESSEGGNAKGGAGEKGKGSVIDLRLTYLRNILEGMEGRVKGGTMDWSIGGGGGDGGNRNKKRKRGSERQDRQDRQNEGNENGNGNGIDAGGYTSDASGWQDPKNLEVMPGDDEEDDHRGSKNEQEHEHLNHNHNGDSEEQEEQEGDDDDDDDEGESKLATHTSKVKKVRNHPDTTTDTGARHPEKGQISKDKRKEDKKARRKADKAAREKQRREQQ